MANPFQVVSDSSPASFVPVNPGTLIQANNSVNGAVDKVIDDFTASKAQGTIDSFLNTGYKQLISAMGVNPEDIPFMQQENGPVVDAGVAAASSLFMQIVNEKLSKANFGPFKSLNYIFNLIKYPTVTIYESLPADLVKMHWFIIFAETFLRKKRLPDIDFRNKIPSALEFTRSYAQDLVTIFQPKQKFLFLMDITFKGPFGTAGLFDPTFTFLLKRADRPKYKIDHEEVNMYNFRTNIPKRVSWDPISIELHDMNDNSSLNFFNTYMKILSPVMRTTEQDPKYLLGIIDSAGMDFDKGFFSGTLKQVVNPNAPWTASLGPLAYNESGNAQGQSATAIIESITIYHAYSFGKFVDIYKYYNPRITDFTLDDLTMSESNTNSVTFTFNYDMLDLKVGVSTATQLNELQRAVADGVKHLNFEGMKKLNPQPQNISTPTRRTTTEFQQASNPTAAPTPTTTAAVTPATPVTPPFGSSTSPPPDVATPTTTRNARTVAMAREANTGYDAITAPPGTPEWQAQASRVDYQTALNHPPGPNDPPNRFDHRATLHAENNNLPYASGQPRSDVRSQNTTVPPINSIPAGSSSNFTSSISSKIYGS